MFYILSESYVPNTAVTNHALSFIKGFSELGVRAQWVFLMNGGKDQRCELNFPGINIKYLWTKFWSKNKCIKHLYKQFAYARFFYSLKPGDTILLLGMSAYVYKLTKRKGVKVYHDRTEHPDAVKNTRYAFSSKNYIKACCNLDGLFVISNALKQYFTSQGVSSSKIHVINMVVDSERFLGLQKNKTIEPYIAYCGNASNNKDGVDDLIKAFAIVSNKFSNITLKVIGPTPKEGSENLKLVENLGIKDKVIFTGIVPASIMPQLLVDAQIVALARPDNLQNRYGFPTKLGEYLLSGNPVVVTNVGDIPLFLKDEETALMADCGDVFGFAEKICWALEHQQQANEIGMRGKELAKRNFNYLIETSKMVEVMFHK